MRALADSDGFNLFSSKKVNPSDIPLDDNVKNNKKKQLSVCLFEQSRTLNKGSEAISHGGNGHA